MERTGQKIPPQISLYWPHQLQLLFSYMHGTTLGLSVQQHEPLCDKNNSHQGKHSQYTCYYCTNLYQGLVGALCQGHRPAQHSHDITSESIFMLLVQRLLTQCC